MWEVSRDFWRFDLEADIADEVLRQNPIVKRYHALLAKDAAARKKELAALSVLLDKLEAYANEHDGKLPSVSADETTTQAEADLMWKVSHDFWRFGLEADIADEVLRQNPIVKRYHALLAKDAAAQKKDRQETQTPSASSSSSGVVYSSIIPGLPLAWNLMQRAANSFKKSTEQEATAAQPELTVQQEEFLAALSPRLDELEAYARKHDGKLPSLKADETTTQAEADLMWEVSRDFWRFDLEADIADEVLRNYPAVKRYQALLVQDAAAQEKIAQEKVAAQEKSVQERIAAEQAAQDAEQKRLAREKAALRKALVALSPQLDQLEAYANAHDGRLPSLQADETTTPEEADLMWEVGRHFVRLSPDIDVAYALRNHPIVKRYQALRDQDRVARKAEATAEEKAQAAQAVKEATAKQKTRADGTLKSAAQKEADLAFERENAEWNALQAYYATLNAFAEAQAEYELQPMSDAQLDAQAVSAAQQADKAVPFVGFMDGAINALLNFYDKLDGMEGARESSIYEDESSDELEPASLIAAQTDDSDLPEETLFQMADKAAQAAAKYMPFSGNITEDIVMQLLNFYDKINPMGGPLFVFPPSSDNSLTPTPAN